MLQADRTFSESERDAVYRAIFTRRDVRSEFLPDAIADDVLARILLAGHHAPSVGFSQPWHFIVIQDASVKQQVKAAFSAANDEAAAMFSPDQQKKYTALKLEGIADAPINLCITCKKPAPNQPTLGMTHMPNMDVYSAVCAVQNMWLAAKSEQVGIGWVSIFHAADLRRILAIPDDHEIIAYLCVGYVRGFYAKPELEHKQWAARKDIKELLSIDTFSQQEKTGAMIAALDAQKELLYQKHLSTS